MRSRASDLLHKIYLFLSFLLIAYAIVDTYRIRWLCDDSFISFRYAKNLVQGRGLVFNSGEYVEGYTNFLWTILLAGFYRAGIELETIALVLGYVSFIATLIALLVAGWFHSRGEGRFLPFAAIAFASMYHSRVFATSGLETSFFTLLITVAAIFSPFYKKGILSSLVIVLVSVLAALTRPEGILYAVFVFLFFASGEFSRNERGKARRILVLAVPFVLLSLWGVWKLYYYGDLLPNTYYAKSGGDSYFTQGFLYFYWFFYSYWFLLPIASFLLIEGIRSLVNRGFLREILLILPFLLHGFYILKVGGDFMFARFFIPLLPFFLFQFERRLSRFSESRRVFLFLLLLLASGFRIDPFANRPLPVVDGIIEEPRVYPLAEVLKVKRDYEPLSDLFRRNNIRIAFVGTQAMQAFYLDPVYAFESTGGLTDRELARRPVEERGRPGHEKRGRPEDYKTRKIDLLLFVDERKDDMSPLDRIQVKMNSGVWQILHYREGFILDLKETGLFTGTDFPDYLDRIYLPGLPTYSESKIKSDYGRFFDYYFHWNRDQGRREAMEQRIREP